MIKARIRRALWVQSILLTAIGVASGQQEDPREPQADPPAKENRLAGALSPHLLAHARNLVQWYPWGTEALERARTQDKPIFMSIGYSACNYCHIMMQECFENEEIAGILNEHFVCIKVDREERPDIDEVYMMATTTANNGRGGWPMTVFMTPSGEPFFCDTYLPLEDRDGALGFKSRCLQIAERWKNNKALLTNEAHALVEKVRFRRHEVPAETILPLEEMTSRVNLLPRGFDEDHGGVRSSKSKFLHSVTLELMLREYGTHPEQADPDLVRLVGLTLVKMARGGVYDQLGGGFFRYSLDPEWFEPSFEKMLPDQATMAGVYLSAYQLTQDEQYARMARDILDYCLADLLRKGGGFYSSREALSEGDLGKYYVWTQAEIDQSLGEQDSRLLCDYFNVEPEGNWRGGASILHATKTDAQFAAAHGMDDSQWQAKFAVLREKLLVARRQRVAPKLDDKILAAWTGLMITTLARAHRILNEPRYGQAASQAGEFILSQMVRDGRLLRVYRKGQAGTAGLAVDYTNVVEGLITLYETTFEPQWLTAAEKMNDSFVKYFQDTDAGGFFATATDAEALWFRSKPSRDLSLPSPNSTATHNLLRLAIHLHRPELREIAERTMRTLGQPISRGYMRRMLWAINFYYDQPTEIVIVGKPEDPATQALVRVLYRQYLPNKVVALSSPADAAKPQAPALVKGKKPVDDKPTAFLCRNHAVQHAVTDPDELARRLSGEWP